MAIGDLHTALKTEIVESLDEGGIQLVLVRLVYGRDSSIMSLHANPHTFSLSGMQTADVLTLLGFHESACSFSGVGKCHARQVDVDFPFRQFASDFYSSRDSIINSERQLQSCGLSLNAGKGGALFSFAASGDGHNSPETKLQKEIADELFRYVFSFIRGGRDKGWVTHLIAVEPTRANQYGTILERIGFKTFEECPFNDFDACWWRMTPFEERGNSLFGSNSDTAYRWFDNAVACLVPALDQLVQTNETLTQYHMGFLPSGTSSVRVRPRPKHNEGQAPVNGNDSLVQVDRTKDYQVAISYAGEDLSLARNLFDGLQTKGVSVFFALNEQSQLWGKDLYQYFYEVFSRASHYCVILVSKTYADKEWTRHELQAAQERALKERGKEYILPLRIDDVELPGLPSTVGYVDARKLGVEEIVVLLMAKLHDDH